ncbi:class I SAM-dependent methyltransferase [Lignipirellula cremea]|uniref:Putative methyltransferase YcgJ n=1 Tax=Lignipirellula cremea TaxID=2528010 RepID=A0A518DN70_9BACT|nr:class I SAM-dependent methyltransferase [Lignipirellula cremea]QDU93280.1 putative methyltransferase YcgJ [Lignipirellula cremea]
MSVSPAPETSVEESFADRLLGLLNGSALTMMISIGHRTGLFDVMAQLPPSTLEEIAAAAELQPRYVREWLHAMTTGRIVEYAPAEKTFRLPAEHAALLTRAASPNNLATVTQFAAVLGSVEDAVVEKFRHGGGVHYCQYSRFHEVMAEESGQTVVAGLMEHILPLAPGLLERLELGIDVLDVGCGSGRAMIHLAARFPRSRFTGLDFSDEAIATARNLVDQLGLANITFLIGDAASPLPPASFDLITAFDAIHDQIEPAAVLRQINNGLRDDGLFLMQDIAGSSHVENNLAHPLAPFMYTISCMHCMTVSLANDGAGLGAMWGKELALEMLQEAGFPQVEVRELEHDFMNYYYLAQKAGSF